MNDKDRSQWVNNDEGLYLVCKRSKMSESRWIKENRALIDEVAKNVTENIQPASYLAYPGGSHGK